MAARLQTTLPVSVSNVSEEIKVASFDVLITVSLNYRSNVAFRILHATPSKIIILIKENKAESF